MAHTSDTYRLHTAVKWNEIGQKLYQQGKYEDALQAFNAAIRAEHEDVVSVLDNRAATYEKLDRLDHALKDGRRMIQYEKKQARGYLRIGKILIKKEEPELALQIYERGLKLCTSADPTYKALHRQTSKLTSECMKPFDFMEALPIELIHLIFSHVSFATLCKCTMVSNRWRRFLSSQPYLWNRIELSRTRPVGRMAMSRYVERAKGTLKSIHIGGVDLQGTKMLYHIFKSSPVLEEMKILSGGLLGDSQFNGIQLCRHLKSLHLGQNVIVEPATVGRILALNRGLELVSIESLRQGPTNFSRREDKIWAMDLPNLQVFHIVCIQWKTYLQLAQVLLNAPNLNTFSVQMGCIYMLWDIESRNALLQYKSLKTLNLGGISFADGGQHNMSLTRGLPPTLECLELNVSQGNWMGLDKSCQLPELRILRIIDDKTCVEFSPMLEAISDRLSALEEFETIWGENFVNGDLMRSPRMGKICRVNYHRALDFDDKLATEMVETWTQLEMITLDEAPITGIAVRAFVEGLPKLKCLVLDKCTKISSDAIEWARMRGIHVRTNVYHVCDSLVCKNQRLGRR